MKLRAWPAQTARLAGLLVSLVAGPALAQPGDPAAEKLGRLVAWMLPLDTVFEMQMAKEPDWPLLGKASRVPPEKLACARRALSSAGFLENRIAEAGEFARRQPASVDAAIRVLEAGAAAMSNAYFSLGAERSQTGKALDEKDVTARFSPSQLSAFIELQSASEHQALRRLIGMPDYPAGDNPEQRARTSGDFRAALSRMLLGSMTRCDISLADIR